MVKFTVKRGDKEVTLDVKLARGQLLEMAAVAASRAREVADRVVVVKVVARAAAVKVAEKVAVRRGGRRCGKGGFQGKAARTLLPGFVPDLADFQVPVKVGSVPKGGQAEKAGVKAGMEVVAVEGKEVTTGSSSAMNCAFRRRPRTLGKAGDKVKITFKAGEKKFDAMLALEMMEVTGLFGGGGGGGGARGDSTRARSSRTARSAGSSRTSRRIRARTATRPAASTCRRTAAKRGRA